MHSLNMGISDPCAPTVRSPAAPLPDRLNRGQGVTLYEGGEKVPQEKQEH